MKKAILALIAMLTLGAHADQLTAADYEFKARLAVSYTYAAAIVAGNAWEQQIYSGLTNDPAVIEVDQEDPSVTWVWLRGGELCGISVKLSTDFGYTLEPVNYACPEFAVEE